MLQMKMENRETSVLFLKDLSHKGTPKLSEKTSLKDHCYSQPCRGLTGNDSEYSPPDRLEFINCCRLLHRHNLKNQVKCQISAPPRNSKSSVGKSQAEDQPLTLV